MNELPGLIDVLGTWAYRRRALVIGAAFCILAVSAEGARRLSFETDVLTLLPRDGRVIPAFSTFLSVFFSKSVKELLSYQSKPYKLAKMEPMSTSSKKI